MDQSKRKVLISTLLTTIILIGGFVMYQKVSKKPAVPKPQITAIGKLRSVNVQLLSPSDQSNEILIDGRLTAFEKVDLASKVSGFLVKTQKNFKEGVYYKKGELIFKVDDTEARYTLVSQRTNLMNAITQMLPDLKFDIPEAFDKWNAYVTNFDFEKNTPPLPETTSQKEKYFVSAKNIYTSYYALKSGESRLGEYLIFAPFNGVVTAATVYPGMYVGPATRLGTFINTSSYELQANLNESDVSQIAVGQKVALKSENLEKPIQGSISRIGNQIDPITQFLPIYVSVSGQGLREGQYFSGNVAGKRFSDVVKISSDWMQDQDHIWTVRDSLLNKTEVAVLKRQKSSVYIKGLAQGTQVVVGNITGLVEGMKVAPQAN